MPHLNDSSISRFLRGLSPMLLGLILLGSSLTHAQQPAAPTVAPTRTPEPVPTPQASDTAKKPPTKPAKRDARTGKAGGKEDRDSRSPPTQRDERGPTGTGTGTGNNMGPT